MPHSIDKLYFQAVLDHSRDFWHLFFFVAVYLILPDEHLVSVLPTLIDD